MAGTMVPVGANTVVMQEQVERHADHIRLFSLPKAGQNVRQAGEDISIGQQIFGNSYVRF